MSEDYWSEPKKSTPIKLGTGAGFYRKLPKPKGAVDDFTAAVLDNWTDGMLPGRSVPGRKGHPSTSQSSLPHQARPPASQSRLLGAPPPPTPKPDRSSQAEQAPAPDRSYDVGPEFSFEKATAQPPEPASNTHMFTADIGESEPAAPYSSKPATAPATGGELSADEIEARALLDPDTGAYNLRHIIRRIEYELTRAQYFGRTVAILVVSIDNFRALGAKHGHALIDKLVRTTTITLFEECELINLIGRYMEDRFLIVCPEMPDEHCAQLSEIIRAKAQSTLVEHQSLSFPLSVSIGIAVSSPEFQDVESLIALADLGADIATERGGNGFCFAAHEDT